MLANSNGSSGGNNVVGDRTNSNSVGGGSSNQNSSSEAKVVGFFPVSDPNSHYGLGGSYNLYTPNETKAAINIMLGVGVTLLTAGTNLLPALGSITIDAVSSPLAVPVGAGFIEGTIKSIFGPDPESSSSMFMNPASDFGMNAAQGIWNGWTVLKGSNPLPNP
jgi:hypothetical protein